MLVSVCNSAGPLLALPGLGQFGLVCVSKDVGMGLSMTSSLGIIGIFLLPFPSSPLFQRNDFYTYIVMFE